MPDRESSDEKHRQLYLKSLRHRIRTEVNYARKLLDAPEFNVSSKKLSTSLGKNKIPKTEEKDGRAKYIKIRKKQKVKGVAPMGLSALVGCLNRTLMRIENEPELVKFKDPLSDALIYLGFF